jgi:hypothetical protein
MGVRNDGTMSITQSTVSNNTGGRGSIISGGTLIISASAIFSTLPRESDGGGISNSGILTVTNSTISGNASNSSGGGISTTGTTRPK